MSNFFFQNVQRYVTLKKVCDAVTPIAKMPRRLPNLEKLSQSVPLAATAHDLQRTIEPLAQQFMIDATISYPYLSMSARR